MAGTKTNLTNNGNWTTDQYGFKLYNNRAAKKVASAKGTANKPQTSNTGSSSSLAGSELDPGSSEFIGSEDHQFVNQWNDPYPLYRPMLVPGQQGKTGSTYSVGFMYADRNGFTDVSTGSSPTNPYGFRFHYNPNEISVSSQADVDFSNQTSGDMGTQYFNNYGSCSFQVLINRQDEVLQGKKTTHAVMGSTNFRDLGTLYDIEWLYRVFNGAPNLNGLKETSLSYVLMATPVHFQFGKYLKFFGRPASIDVDHILFTAGMVPMVSTVQVTIVGLKVQGTDNANLASATSGAVTKSGQTTTRGGGQPSRPLPGGPVPLP